MQASRQQSSTTDEADSYEIEKLLDKREVRRGRGVSTEYLVRWAGYGPEHDAWYNVKDLEDSKDLVDDYERALLAS